MKQFTVLFTILGVLAFWAGFQTWSEAGSASNNASDLPKVYDATGAMQEAINPKSANVGIAPVYDATGAMLEAQNRPVVAYSNALELQYAQPWLDKANLPIAVTGNAQEQIPFICSSSSHMFYVCKYGYGLP